MSAFAPVDADPLAAFMPWVVDDERSLRRRILTFQQRAGTRARQCEDDRGRSIWWLICDVAAETAFAPALQSHLTEVLENLTRLALCAGAFERWENPRG